MEDHESTEAGPTSPLLVRLLAYCIVMFVGAFMAGYIPLTYPFSERR